MDEDLPAEADWADEVQHLLLHGRDREAAEVAALNLHGGSALTTPSSGGHHAMGPVEQLDQLGPLLGQVVSGLTPADLDARTLAEVEAFARQAIADEMRDGGTVVAEVAAPAGATPIERLAAFTGRFPG